MHSATAADYYEPADWATSGAEGGVMASYNEYITRVKGVQGGEPILKGTRTPVRSVAVLYHFTYLGDLAKVQAALPHLEPDQIEAALAYYEDHQEEIHADLRRHEKALEALQKVG